MVGYKTPNPYLKTPVPPLGLLMIGAVLEKQGLECQLFDMIREGETNVMSKVRDMDIVMFSLFIEPGIGPGTFWSTGGIGFGRILGRIAGAIERNQGLSYYDPIIRIAKEKLVIVGGGLPTFFDDELLRGGVGHICVRSEGEKTIDGLIDALNACEAPFAQGELSDEFVSRLREIQGISFLDKGRVVRTANRPFMSSEELGSLPAPAWHLAKKYEVRKIPYYSARGCRHNCRFCVVRQIWGQSVRAVPVSKVKSDIAEGIAAFGTRYVYFNDDTFTYGGLPRVRELCKALKDIGVEEFEIQTRIDALTEEIIDVLADAGCVVIAVGIESFSPTILKGLRKGMRYTYEEMLHILEYAINKGIILWINLILLTPDTRKEDLPGIAKGIRGAHRLYWRPGQNRKMEQRMTYEINPEVIIVPRTEYAAEIAAREGSYFADPALEPLRDSIKRIAQESCELNAIAHKVCDGRPTYAHEALIAEFTLTFYLATLTEGRIPQVYYRHTDTIEQMFSLAADTIRLTKRLCRNPDSAELNRETQRLLDRLNQLKKRIDEIIPLNFMLYCVEEAYLKIWTQILERLQNRDTERALEMVKDGTGAG